MRTCADVYQAGFAEKRGALGWVELNGMLFAKNLVCASEGCGMEVERRY